MWDEFKPRSAWSFHKYSLRQAERIRPNDLCVVYLTKSTHNGTSRLAALIEAIGPLREPPQDSQTGSFYPYQLPFRLIGEPKSAVSFRELVPALSFIRRKERYGVFIQGKSAILLSTPDAEVVLRAIGSVAGHPHGRFKRVGRGKSLL